MTRTTAQLLGDLLLGQPVEEFIAERRAAGASWSRIARDLYEATDRQLDVSDRAIRNWMEQQAGSAA